jgi:hypothetical protein
MRESHADWDALRAELEWDDPETEAEPDEPTEPAVDEPRLAVTPKP